MFHGSYLKEDVTFLLKPVELEDTDLTEKEFLIQSGKKHYSEMVSAEYIPSLEYLDVFYQAMALNKVKMANNIISLAKLISEKKKPVLISLARAGTPVGVLLKRALQDIFGKESIHYSISIIRDKGIDENALKYILKYHQQEEIVFIDGWTGKGVITNELRKSIELFNQKYNTKIPPIIHVLSDLSGKADISVTYEDYLIPSAVLNSTISGLISRTILNKLLIGPDDFHGCKYYKNLADSDLSRWFINEIMEIIHKLSIDNIEKPEYSESKKAEMQKISHRFITETMSIYNVKNINYIKPGIGETTRVLLRRVPDRILINDVRSKEVEHLLVLAKEKKVLIEQIENMPYKAVGIISGLER